MCGNTQSGTRCLSSKWSCRIRQITLAHVFYNNLLKSQNLLVGSVILRSGPSVTNLRDFLHFFHGHFMKWNASITTTFNTLKKRENITKSYVNKIILCLIQTPQSPSTARHANHRFAVERARLRPALQARARECLLLLLFIESDSLIGFN